MGGSLKAQQQSTADKVMYDVDWVSLFVHKVVPVYKDLAWELPIKSLYISNMKVNVLNEMIYLRTCRDILWFVFWYVTHAQNEIILDYKIDRTSKSIAYCQM